MMINAHQKSTSPWKPLNLASSDSLWTSTWRIALSSLCKSALNHGVSVLSTQIAASDRQHGASDIGGLIGSEEQDRRHLLVDGPVPVHQTRLLGLIDHALVPLAFLRARFFLIARDTAWWTLWTA